MLIAAAFIIEAKGSVAPVVAAAPLVAAPAAVGYAHAVPQNIPPYADQISVVNRGLSTIVAAPAIAAPLAAPISAYAAPYAAPLAASYAATPYLAGAGPLVPAPYAASAYGLPGPYAAPYPYAAPLARAPLGLAPAFVR